MLLRRINKEESNRVECRPILYFANIEDNGVLGQETAVEEEKDVKGEERLLVLQASFVRI